MYWSDSHFWTEDVTYVCACVCVCVCVCRYAVMVVLSDHFVLSLMALQAFRIRFLILSNRSVAIYIEVNIFYLFQVIQLEQELLETQRKAGFPVVLPYDSSSLRQLTPQLSRRQQAPPVKPLLEQLETELSDTEISDISPEDGDKTATVERKVS